MPTSPILFYKKGTCALGSMIAYEWINQPYQLCRLDHELIESEAFLKINPLGLVPTLITDEMIITESTAILQYIGLLDLSLGLVFEQGTPQFHRLNQVLSYLSSNFHRAFSPLVHLEDFSKDRETQKEIKHNVIETNIRENYQFIDQYLVKEGLIFGHKTVADAYLYGVSRWGKSFFNLNKEFPNVARFQTIMEDDPAVQFALNQEENKLSSSTGKLQGHIALEFVTLPENPAYGLRLKKEAITSGSRDLLRKV